MPSLSSLIKLTIPLLCSFPFNSPTFFPHLSLFFPCTASLRSAFLVFPMLSFIYFSHALIRDISASFLIITCPFLSSSPLLHLFLLLFSLSLLLHLSVPLKHPPGYFWLLSVLPPPQGSHGAAQRGINTTGRPRDT